MVTLQAPRPKAVSLPSKLQDPRPHRHFVGHVVTPRPHCPSVGRVVTPRPHRSPMGRVVTLQAPRPKVVSLPSKLRYPRPHHHFVGHVVTSRPHHPSVTRVVPPRPLRPALAASLLPITKTLPSHFGPLWPQLQFIFIFMADGGQSH